MAKEIKAYFNEQIGRSLYKPTMARVFRNEFDYCKIPTIGWGKAIYGVMNGKLRALRFVRIDYFTYNVHDYTDSLQFKHIRILMNVAGIGEVCVLGYDWKNLPFSIYESVEDFQNGVEYSMMHDADICGFYDMLRSADNGRRMFTHTISNGEDNLWQYMWDSGKCEVKKVYAELPPYISYSQQEGFYAPQWQISNGRYATSDECKKANEVQVVEFEDVERNNEIELRRHIRTEVMRTFCSWLTASDIESVATAIADEVVEDVKVCSDYPNYNDSDVRLAIQRAVMGRVIGE